MSTCPRCRRLHRWLTDRQCVDCARADELVAEIIELFDAVEIEPTGEAPLA